MLKQICAVIDCSKDESMHLCPRECGEEYEKFHRDHDHEDEEGEIYDSEKNTILNILNLLPDVLSN